MSADEKGQPFGNVGNFPKVQGKCPACGRDSLFLGTGGYITCSIIGCPNPSAVDAAIAAMQGAHVVTTLEDPRAHAQMGDRAESNFEEICEATNRGRYVCTREPGHPGHHIAEDMAKVVMCWHEHPAPTPDAEAIAQDIESLVDDMGDPAPGWRAGVMAAAEYVRRQVLP